MASTKEYLDFILVDDVDNRGVMYRLIQGDEKSLLMSKSGRVVKTDAKSNGNFFV